MNHLKRIFSGILCAAALAAATQTVSAKEAAAVESTSVFNRSYNVASSYPNATTDLTAITDLSQQKLVDEAVIDAYLKNAGFSAEFIEVNDYSIKLELYNAKATFSSAETTYGIMTDDCHISYTVNDDGSIKIETEELAKFEKLLAEDESVRKILNDKATSKNEAELAKICETKAGLTVLRAMPSEVAIRVLTNWSATLTCAHIYYKKVNGAYEAQKKLTYNWRWAYEPVWTLTDKVALAWSGGFIAEVDGANSPRNVYQVIRIDRITGKEEVYYLTADIHHAYDDYICDAGIAKAIDIKNFANNNHFYKFRHEGTYIVTITLNPAAAGKKAAVGCYYHTRILPKLTLSFSETPAIEVTEEFSVDKAPDTAVTFYVTQ